MRSLPTRRLYTAILLLIVALLPASVTINALELGDDEVVVESSVVQMVSADNEGIAFDLQLSEVNVDADGVVTATGLNARINTPGAPELPYFKTLIALPPEANVRATVSATQSREQNVDFVRPAPDANQEAFPENIYEIRSLEAYGLVHEADSAIYESAETYPSTFYTVSDPMYIRDVRIVELTVYPVRYNPDAGQLLIAEDVAVDMHFVGAQFDNLNPATAVGTPFGVTNVLNSAQAENWRSLPKNSNAIANVIPVGAESFKIEVNETGIYELTYSELQAAGMNVNNVNPNTFEMMYGGNVEPYDPDNPQPYTYEPKSVAYEFVGDGDNNFESGEAIRFFGWAWDGNRHDRQYLTNNVYWLWANGSADEIATVSNPSSGPTATYWPAKITYQEDNYLTDGRTDQWHTFENEADGWYWERLNNAHRVDDVWVTQFYEFDIDVPHVVAAGPDATVIVEIFNWIQGVSGPQVHHEINAEFNDNGTFSREWFDENSVNLTQVIPAANIVSGNNILDLWGSSLTDGGTGTILTTDKFHFNRVSVLYPRAFVADSNQLIFEYDTAGAQQFSVTGFNQTNVNSVHVWDISDRVQPRKVDLGSADVNGNGNNVTYRIGTSDGLNKRFIATTSANLLDPAAISEYVAPSLDSPSGGADWVMITNVAFRTQSDQLAVHRANHSNMDTHVVNYHDVINQYGYGLETPAAVQNYVRHTMLNWSQAPTFIVLGGDGTRNHLQRDCTLSYCLGSWSTEEESWILTDLLMEDRFNGLIPSDHTFASIIGDDIYPDIAVGRFTAETTAEFQAMIDKLILFESDTAALKPWTQHYTFLADNDDQGGPFCASNENVMNNFLPDSFGKTAFCLDDYEDIYDTPEEAQAALRLDLFAHLAQTGTSVLNYRGHGSVVGWAGGLLNNDNFWEMANEDHPMIVLSADCLDGNFAVNGTPAFSETMLETPDLATAAHWSSTGLGFNYEHTALHEGVYISLYENGDRTLGEAIVYSKIAYLDAGRHESEVYAFTMQGDPAITMPLDLSTLNPSLWLPILEQ